MLVDGYYGHIRPVTNWRPAALSKSGLLAYAGTNGSKQSPLLAIALFAIHAVYHTLRLPYLLLKEISITHLSLLTHVTTILGMMAIWFLHYTALFHWPGVTVTCFNKAFETWGLESAGDFCEFINFVKTGKSLKS